MAQKTTTGTPKTAPTAADMARPLSQGYDSPFTLHFDKNDPPPATRGEYIFNAFDWYGIGWIVNAALGVGMAHTLSHGAWQPAFNHFNEKLGTEWFTKGAFEAMGGGVGAPAIGAARGITTLAALMSGGYMCMLPIKIIHDYKKPLVVGLDNLFGKRNPTDSEQKLIDARHQYLDHEPHVSTWNALSGRTATMGIILGVHYALGQPQIAQWLNPKTTFKGFEQQFSRFGEGSYNMLRATDKGAKWLDGIEKNLEKTTQELTQRFAGNAEEHYVPSPKSDQLKKIFSLAYEDIFYSFWGATGTMVFSKAFAHRDDQKSRPNATITDASHERMIDQPNTQLGHR